MITFIVVLIELIEQRKRNALLHKQLKASLGPSSCLNAPAGCLTFQLKRFSTGFFGPASWTLNVSSHHFSTGQMRTSRMTAFFFKGDRKWRRELENIVLSSDTVSLLPRFKNRIEKTWPAVWNEGTFCDDGNCWYKISVSKCCSSDKTLFEFLESCSFS